MLNEGDGLILKLGESDIERLGEREILKLTLDDGLCEADGDLDTEEEGD